jgi:hypothetical protein
MWTTYLQRGLIAVALALVAVVLGLTQPFPAGAQEGTTVTTEDPVAAIDPFGDDIVVTSPTECFDNTTATVPDYGPSGWTCTDSWAAANADLAVPDHGADDSSQPAWAVALQFGAAVLTVIAAIGRWLSGRT